jgi:glycosyltransferase involved in cell wall biosynthesis
MKFSVVIPTYNRRNEVLRAIDSVFVQTLPAFETIVVDDNSTDGTIELIQEKYPTVKLIVNQKNVGGAIARNIGALSSTGDLIAFLDSDDEWQSAHLERAKEIFLACNPDGLFSNFYLDNSVTRREIKFGIAKTLKGELGNLIFSTKRVDARTSTFVFKREIFAKIQFDPKLRKHQDWDLAINFDQLYDFYFDSKPTVIIHVPETSLRMSNSLNHDATIYFLKKNSRFIESNNLFVFYLKMLFRCERIGDQDGYRYYLQEMKKLKNKIKIQFKVILLLVSMNLLKPSLIHTAKTIFIKR